MPLNTKLLISINQAFDIAGSVIVIALSILAVRYTRKLYRRKRGESLWLYLHGQALVFAIFAVSRYFGHVVHRVLHFVGEGELWITISPITGAINTLTFIAVGIFALLYQNLNEIYRDIEMRRRAEETIRKRSAELEALYSTTRAASSSLKLDKILNSALKEITRVMGAEAGAVHLENSGTLRLAAHIGLNGRLLEHIKDLPSDNSKGSGYAADAFRKLAKEAGLSTAVGVPIKIGQQRLGVITVGFKHEQEISDGELKLLKAIGEAVGVAVMNAQLFSEVKERERQIRAVIDSMKDSILVIDRDFTVQEVNHHFLEEEGLKRDAVVGRKCYEIFHHRSNRCSSFGEICPLEEVFSTGETVNALYTHLDSYGRRRYVEIVATPLFGEGGQVASIVHISRDVTQRVGQEEEERVLRDIAGMLATGATPSEILQMVVHKLRITFGYDIAAACLLKDGYLKVAAYSAPSLIVEKLGQLAELSPIGYRIPIREGTLFEDIITRRRYIITADIEKFVREHIGEDKLEKLALLMEALAEVNEALAVPMESGNAVIGVIGVATRRELTPQDAERLMRFARQVGVTVERAELYKKLEKAHEELKKAYAELKSINELKSNIIANVSHELRTPITIAKGFVELALEERDKEMLRDELNYVLSALLRLDSIVGDLITFAGINSGDLQLKFEKARIEEIVSEAVEAKEEYARSKKIKIEVELKHTGDVYVDSHHLQRALAHLIDNAIKFNHEGGEVKVKVEREGDAMLITVNDTGIGIPEDKLEEIFEPLTQLDSGSTRRYGGTGTGLAVVKRIIEAHGGKIWVKSELGKGSTFYVHLPFIR
jgi:PAS domain S-box-containing protein